MNTMLMDDDDADVQCPSQQCECDECTVTCVSCKDPLGDWVVDADECVMIDGLSYCRDCVNNIDWDDDPMVYANYR